MTRAVESVGSALPPLPGKVRIPLRRRLTTLAKGPGQFVVWLLVGAAGLWVAGAPTAPSDALGIVRGDEVSLSFARAGRIAELLVEPEADVTAGTTIARLDGALLDARIVVAQQEVASVAADVKALAAARRQLATERVLDALMGTGAAATDGVANRSRVREEVWRLEIEVRERRLSALAVEVEIETDRLTIDQIRVQEKRFDSLVKQGFARAADVQDRDLAVRTILGTIDANERLLASLREEAATAAERLDEVRTILTGMEAPVAVDDARGALEAAARDADVAALDALERRVSTRRAEVEMLRVELESLTLIATIDGRVARIDARVGQSVSAGAVVLLVQAREPRDVVVYLPEPVERDAALPKTVMLARRAAPTVAQVADVIGYGEGVAELPERLWLRPGVPEFGRTLVVRAPAELGLIPGEAVSVRLSD